MNTNIPGLAELQERRAQEERQRRAAIMNGQLLPFSVNTNVPGLAEAQARAYSIAHEAQPQDVEEAQAQLGTGVLEVQSQEDMFSRFLNWVKKYDVRPKNNELPPNADRRRPIGQNFYGDIGYVDTQETLKKYEETGNLHGVPRRLAELGIGAANFGGQIALSGPAEIFANVGRAGQHTTALMDSKTNEMLQKLGREQGIPDEALQSLAPQENYATSLAKDLSTLSTKWKGVTDEAYRYVVGDNPALIDRMFHGSGTSLGYMLMAMLFGKGIAALPKLAELGATSPAVAKGIASALGHVVSGQLESLSEAGTFLSDSYAKNPANWDKAVETSDWNFLANALGNMPINAISGFVNAFAGPKLANPLRNFAVTLLGEQVNEIPQETLQMVVENASEKTLKSGDTSFSNFWGNLKDEAKKAPEYMKALAAEVAGATTISHAITWMLPFATHGGRHDLVREAVKERMRVHNGDLTNPDLAAPSENAERQKSTYDSYTKQKEDLQSRLNDIYAVGNEELDTNPENQQDIQDILASTHKVEEQLKQLADLMEAPTPSDEAIDMFPENEKTNQSEGAQLKTDYDIEHNGKKYTFKVTSGEFNDKNFSHRKYFGHYLEIQDADGNVIARYSPYVDDLEFSKDAPDDPDLHSAVEKLLKKNMQHMLDDHSFLNEYGGLINDGNGSFRHKLFDRKRKSEFKQAREEYEREQSEKGVLGHIKDDITSRINKVKSVVSAGKKILTKGYNATSDMFKPRTAKINQPSLPEWMERLINERDELQKILNNTQAAQAINPNNNRKERIVELQALIDAKNQSIADVQDELDRENLDLYPSDDDSTPPAGQDETQDDLDAKPRGEKIGLFDEAEADAGETYNQTVPGSEDDTDAGDFIFTYRPRNGSNQSYRFRVTATGGVDPTSRYAYSPTTRGKRYSGRSLELRNKLGRVIARYSPYLDYFRILGSEKAHPQGWGKALEGAFRANLNQYLSRGGFLDSSGNLLSDGNEDFRRAWDRRRQDDTEAFSEGFQSDFVQPEDLVAAAQGQHVRPTITVNYDGSTHTLTVLPISDKIIDAIDEHGQTVGRYDAENSKFLLTSPFSSQSWSRELGHTLEQTFRQNIGSYLSNDTSDNLSRMARDSSHTLTVQHNGETHQLTVEPHDYSDSRKARYGTVLDIKDEQGRTVARYSPKNFMFAVSPKFRGQEWTQGIAQALGQNINSILGDNNTHPILPDPASLIPNTAPKAEQQADTRRSPRGKKGIADRIRSVLGESYNQSTEGESTGTDNSQGSSSGKVRTLTVEHKGKRQTFTVHEGEFSNKHARHKKLFGKYLEVRDSNGKSIARYSVSGDKFSAAPGTDASLASAVESELRDKLGAMLRTGRSDTPHSKTAKPTEKKSFGERLHDFVFGQEGDTRSFRQRFKDTRDERKAFNHVRKQIQAKIEQALNELYDLYKDEGLLEIMPMGLKDRREIKPMAKLYSTLYAARLSASAHLGGMKIEELAKIWSLEFKFRTTEDYTRGTTDFNPKKEIYDDNGKLIRSEDIKDDEGNVVRTIIYLSQITNASTILHEFGHLFLQDMRRLVQLEGVPDSVLNDWAILTEWLGVSDIDLTKPTGELSPEEIKRWTDAHEKFATAFEKYLMTNEAPTSKLKRAFEAFKQWLLNIYEHISNIKYVGKDGKMHAYHLSDEIRKVMGRMLQDVQYVPNAEAAKNSSFLRNTREVYKQAVQENMRRGSEAMNKVITEHTNVIDAMHRDDLGNISFIWGNPGKGKKFKGGLGVSHIIAHRNAQGYDGESVARKMVEVIALGDISRQYGQNIPNGERANISYDGYTAVLSLYKDGNRQTWLLTGWKDYEESPDVSGEGYGSTSATLNEPMRTRLNEGAENLSGSIRSPNSSVNNTTEIYNQIVGVKGARRLDEAPKRIGRGNETFLTQEQLERYDQLAYQGTPNIVRGGFNLRYIGTGEGGQAFGWGLYFAQIRKVAEEYRKKGISKKAYIYITYNDTDYMFDPDLEDWTNEYGQMPSEAALEVMDAIAYGLNKKDDVDAVIDDLYDVYNEKLENAPDQETIDFLQEYIDILDNITSAWKEQINGNLYMADIPENDVLLNWDAKLSEQPEKVQKGLKKVIAWLAKCKISAEAIKRVAQAKTGQDFYLNLQTALKELMKSKRLTTRKHGDIISRADMAASLLLNQAGIPGLRYWDGFSRDNGEGTHNFVIWNTDLIKMMGISEDSDEEAKDAFREEYPDGEIYHQLAGSDKTDTYHQIFGERGGAALDLRNRTSKYRDRLNVAKFMERTGASTDYIWQNTGWMRGADSKWRFEVPDGTLNKENTARLRKLSKLYYELSKKIKDNPEYTFTPEEQRLANTFEAISITLPDIYNSAELFKAYPEARDIKIIFDYLGDSEGEYDSDSNTIFIDYGIRSFHELRKTLIHEVQHAIQSYEGFTWNEEFRLEDDKRFKSAKRKYDRILSKLDDASAERVKEVLNTEKSGKHVQALFKMFKLSSAERKAYRGMLDAMQTMQKRKANLIDYYERMAEEVEARNAETRADWDAEARMATPLDASEDVEREQQLVGKLLPRGEESGHQDNKQNINAREYANGEVYHQVARSVDNFILSPEAQRQMEEVRAKYEGTAQWMRAPNGKKSNLTERQWVMVRTPNFKHWFGDWENEPQNASKVVDENGEPLVVYHGTAEGNGTFAVFHTEPDGAHFGSWSAAVERGAIMSGYNDNWIDNYDDVEDYEEYEPDNELHADIFECFLNIRNLKRVNDQGDSWKSAIKHAQREGVDGLVYMNDTEDYGSDSYVVFQPTQIKSSERNNGNFNPADEDIYHQPALGRQTSIRDVLDIMRTEQGRKNSGNVWADYARVSPEEARRISEATGLDISDRYVHTIIGSAVTHTLNRHGEGNEQRQDQLPITDADFERIPYIIQNADEIKRGNEKATGGVNDTIVYKKRINGHVLVVEEVRNRRGKLAFYTMRKTKAGYDYDLSTAEHTIVREGAKSQRITSDNALTPEVQFPHALSTGDSVQDSIDTVNGDTAEQYHQAIGVIGARALDKAEGVTTRMDNLKVAKRMEREGIPAKNMWFATNWMRGADKKWRYEIMDGKLIKRYSLSREDWELYNSLASRVDILDYNKYDELMRRLHRMSNSEFKAWLNSNNHDNSIFDTSKLTNEELRQYYSICRILDGTTLPDVFDAPELYKAYPQLRNIVYQEMYMEDKDGATYPGLIRINNDLSDGEARTTFIHEIQHIIQSIEGFAIGANISLETDAIYQRWAGKMDAIMDTLDEETFRKMTEALIMEEEDPVFSKRERNLYSCLKKIQAQLRKRAAEVFSEYDRSAGEVEARNAEKRADFDVETRRRTPLDITESIPRQQQVIRYSKIDYSTPEIYNQPLNSNMDRVEMSEAERRSTPLDVTEDTPRSEQIVRRQRHYNAESYQQIISIDGARTLDKSEGVTWRMDNLNMAKSMERKGLTADKIWYATGWQRGTDTAWRMELLDGKISMQDFRLFSKLSDKVYTLQRLMDNGQISSEQQSELSNLENTLTRKSKISTFYNNEALFKAYPQLKDMPIEFMRSNDWAGFYNPNRRIITLNPDISTARELRRTLIHEIQHAIQHIEGLAAGGGLDSIPADKNGNIDFASYLRKNARRQAAVIASSISPELRQKFKDLLNAEHSLSPSAFKRLVKSTLGQDERRTFAAWKRAHTMAGIPKNLPSITPRDAYDYIAGEVEARNAAERSGWGEKRRRRTPLDRSEDIEREGQIVIDNYGRALKNSDTGAESYNQIAKSTDEFTLTPEAQAQMEEVRRQYEGTDKWMKAPNGKPTKLTEHQWLAVRTPNFKKWFGDWEAAQMVKTVKDFLENSEPVSTITGDEFQKGSTPLVDRVLDYYMETGNTVVSNSELGEVILDRRGIKDSSAHGLGKEKAAAFAVVPDVIRNGLVYDRQSNWKGRKYDTATLIANVKIGGEDYVCEVIVKRNANKQGFYLHEVELKRNLDGVFKTVLNNGTPARSRLIISDYVKRAANASKVVDENGEPRVVYHGTSTPIEDIRTFKRGTVGWLGPGIYLTPFIEYALNFSDKGEAGIMSLFLNLKNPLVLNSTWQIGRPYLELLQKLYGDRADSIYKERYDAVVERDKDILANMPDDAKRRQYIHRRIVTGEEVQQLLAQGYDGINWDDGEYSVLNSNQIKSATGNNGNFSDTDLDVYHQKSFLRDRIRNALIGIDGKGNKQAISISEQQIEAVRRQYEGTAQWMKAPNGKRTNLTEKQWLTVRTENFKRWFGDWEHDPQNASKVLDENGEPMVVYHGTQFDRGGFSVFNTKGHGKTKNTGAWFNSNIDVARTYFTGSPKKSFYHVFLNIRNPYIVDAQGKLWREIPLKGRRKLFSTNDIAREVWKGKMDKFNTQDIPFDGVIIKNVEDNGSLIFPMPIGDDYVVPKANQIKSATRNNGEFSDAEEIYNQQGFERFEPDAEQQFSDSFGDDDDDDDGIERITKAFSDFLHGFKGDYPELATAIATNPKLMFAREVIRKMTRSADAKILLAVRDLARSLSGLNKWQLNIFARFMLLNDIHRFKASNPNATLPLRFTPQSFAEDVKKFTALVNNDTAIKDAVLAERKLQKEVNERLATLAAELGMPKLAEKVRRNNFYMLEYARLLKGKGINTDYIQVVVNTRTEQLKDIEHLEAIKQFRAYNIKDKLIQQFGKDWRKHIPKGYDVFNPLQGDFIKSAQTLTDRLLGISLEAMGQQLGLSENTMKALRANVSDNSGSHLLVLPEALTHTLDKLAIPVQRGFLGKVGKWFTTHWKPLMLFFPTRAIKYNIRNLTGDLDAVIAGNPLALAYVPQAISELYRLYYVDGEATPELREFQERGGAVTIQSTQDLGDYKQLKEYKRLANELKGKKQSVWAALPRKTWALLDKVAWSGIQHFSDFREQWIRYACYLSYLNQMQSNDEHLPSNWGASVKEEVMSIPARNDSGIRDRAFKMSNELIGAYDQITESGKYLRDLLIPFYSWLEVNAKRYYRFIKNGITEDGLGDFASRFLKGQLANAPYYAFKLAKTYILVNLLAMLIAAFNKFVWPEDEDKLPPDIQAKPHITLGHDSKGNVLYFDRVGAMLDNLEWFGQEDSPFVPFAKDVKDIFDGKQTFTGLAAKLINSPFNKVIQGLNPFIKSSAEIIFGQSIYPDFTHPHNINDRWQYLAQSFGVSWPYKAITGKPIDNWKEFKNLFLYQADADEAAYFYTLGLVRKYQEDILGKRTAGFAVSQRGQALRQLKAALRLNDTEAVSRYLNEYYKLGGSEQGLSTSIKNMNPLHGLNKTQQKQFLAGLNAEDRKYYDRAVAFFEKIKAMADKLPAEQQKTVEQPKPTKRGKREKRETREKRTRR